MISRSLKPYLLFLFFILFYSIPSKSAAAQSICPDPNHPCGTFKAYELPFRIAPSRVARAEDQSELFYAIILKSAPACSIAGDEGTAAQSLFPAKKVFVSRFECGEEDNVTYTTSDKKFGILAVYAGKTMKEAEALVAVVRK